MTSPKAALRPQQEIAVKYPGNVAVSAGAGSGKTFVLVERYFHLLTQVHPEWPLSSVVAITFTVKAASELRVRIVERVRAELSRGDLSESQRQRLSQMRREIASAPVGTIHNFCSRILREFAFEARLDPGFQILEGIEETALLREAVTGAMGEAAAHPASDAYEDLLLLLTLYSRRALSELLERMLRRRGEFAPLAERYTRHSTEELFGELTRYAQQVFAQRRLAVKENLDTAVWEVLARLGETALPAEIEQLLAPWREGRSPDNAPEQLCEIASSLRQSLFTQKGTLRKSLEKVIGSRELLGPLEELRLGCEATDTLTQAKLGQADRENLEISRMLSRLFLRTNELYARSRSAAASRSSNDLLDFSDLELRVEALLASNRRVRERLRQAVRFLIIDEFQDTSETQWRIIERLVCGEDGQMLPGRFFMVGDPKQSIYGFRQAGSRIFDRVRDLVADSNRAVSEPGLGNVHLTENFRTLATPLEFVNRLFEKVLGEANSPYGVEFEALEPQRSTAPGHVELLVTNPAEKREEESEELVLVQSDEAETVAETIEQLLASRAAVWKRQQGKEIARAIEPGDIALLFRKRKHFALYEAALRARGIPFVTYRGKGLYDQPEILDLIAWLKLLLYPTSDFTLAQVLRGGVVNFPDDLLMKISLFSGPSYWEKCIQAYASREALVVRGVRVELSEEERKRLGFVLGLVGSLERRAGFVEVGELLQQIVGETGAVAIYGASARGMQAQANLRRFLDIARRLETSDLEEFLDYIEGQAADPRGEGEASPENEMLSAVRILTIHAAKGLEFPVVFLPELSEKLSARDEELVCDASGWFAVSKSRSLEEEKVFLHRHLNAIEREKGVAEERRVFYVAATRCRDRLYLSATLKDKRGESLLEWIEQPLDLCEAVGAGRAEARFFDSPGQSVALRVRTPQQKKLVMAEEVTLCDTRFQQTNARYRTLLGGQAAAVLARSEAEAQMPAVEQLRAPLAPRLTEPPVHAQLRAEELLRFAECPEEYFLQVATRQVPHGASPGAFAPVDASVRATLLHAGTRMRRTNPEADVHRYFQERLSATGRLDGPQCEAFAGELLNRLDALETCMALGGQRCDFEKELLAEVGQLLVSATFDCEFEGGEGVEIAAFFAQESDMGQTPRAQLHLFLLSLAHPRQERYTLHQIRLAGGQRQLVCMQRGEVEAFGRRVRQWAQEYLRFARVFCQTSVLVSEVNLKLLASWCQGRGTPCPRHVLTAEGEN